MLVTERVVPLPSAAGPSTRSGCPTTGGSAATPGHRRLGQRPVRRHPRPERAHPGVQGRLLRHPAGPPAHGPGAAATGRRATGPGRHHRRPTGNAPAHRHRPPRRTDRRPEEADASIGSNQPVRPDRPGRRRRLGGPAAAQGLLHRHLDLHRLQGVRGGVQGVERRPRRTASTCSAPPTTTPARWVPSTWRHVAFIEQPSRSGAAEPGAAAGRPRHAAVQPRACRRTGAAADAAGERATSGATMAASGPTSGG